MELKRQHEGQRYSFSILRTHHDFKFPLLTLMLYYMSSSRCRDGKAPWRYTSRPHSSQLCEPSKPKYLFMQGCSMLSLASREGDLNDLLVHPHCSS